YDPVKDLAPISVIGTNPYVLVVHAGIPARTLAEFVDYARGQPGKLSYVAPIFGGLSHLSMVLFLKRAGLEMTPVVYKAAAAPHPDSAGRNSCAAQVLRWCWSSCWRLDPLRACKKRGE